MSIHLWHAFQGKLQTEFDSIIGQFNQDQSSNPDRYVIIPTAYNSYTKIVQDALEQMGEGPQILQVSEYQTITMMANQHRIRPIEDLVESSLLEDITELVKKTFCDNHGKLCSLPFNPSCGILYINRNALNQGGYDPNYVPKTFDDIQKVSQDLIQKEIIKYGWTTAWPAAYHVEVRKAQQNKPLAEPDNGWNMPSKMSINQADDVAYFNHLKQQQKEKTFIYCGRTSTSMDEFCLGNVAFYLQGASQAQTIKDKANFHVNYAKLPSYGDHHSFAFPLGGASFWVLESEKTQKMIDGVKAFMNYLASPKVQIQWHTATSYVPVSKSAIQQLKDSNFYDQHALHALVVEQTIGSPMNAYSYGIRLPNYPAIREKIVDQIEQFLQSDVDDSTDFLNSLVDQIDSQLRSKEFSEKSLSK